ncbi:MAG: resolvase [Leptolyngbya foveolarum]|uniref:Resolvase n=1 Tax=Leptolyngbya foveolarum TaxID=47253 RepID=A0A2W4W5P2_9CYAN|nr:MAG: resolvase [Leptolyngbya foveolarum]
MNNSAIASEESIVVTTDNQLLPIESVQKILNRSRASVYRYANTHHTILNPPFDPKCLNPEVRNDKDAPLMFHPNEVARFAQNVLGIRQVTIKVAQPAETETHRLLKAVLTEMQAIRELLERWQSLSDGESHSPKNS